MTRARHFTALAVWLAALPLNASDPLPNAVPYYTAASVVSAADFSPAPLAPNAIATIFGTGLAFDTVSGDGSTRGLGGVHVYLGHLEVPLLFVSPTQINFLVRPGTLPDDMDLTVTRESVSGPQVPVTVYAVAPALFRSGNGNWIIAAHNSDFSAITPGSPARPGEMIVLYASGLGTTNPTLPATGPPRTIAWITRAADLRVLLNDEALDAWRIAYAGVSPGWLGLYQVNVQLPSELPDDPEISIAIGGRRSSAGLHLPAGPMDAPAIGTHRDAAPRPNLRRGPQYEAGPGQY